MSDALVNCSIDEQIKEAERELALRRNFYRKQVARHLMSEDLAVYRIEVMEAIVNSLKLLRAPIPELQGCQPLVLYFRTEEDRNSVVTAIQSAYPTLTPRRL